MEQNKKDLNQQTNEATDKDYLVPDEDSTEKKSEDKKKKQIIIALCVAVIIIAIALAASLTTLAVKSFKNKSTTKYVPTQTPVQENLDNSDKTSVTQAGVSLADKPSLEGSNIETNISASKVVTNKVVMPKPEKTTKNEYVEHYEELSKNGKNILSDDPNNEFIKLISEKYGVKSELLVAVYSEPDSGTNFVLQFSGKRDEKGNIIKSPDTLSKVYHIDKERNIKIATGGMTGNVGVSYAEGMLCFHMVKTLVMEQYPNYFTGLPK